jgi:hypothetical protein
MALLRIVAGLGLPDCWIGAGFVRAAVWDHLHERAPSAPDEDVDVVWFDGAAASADADHAIEHDLRSRDASVRWSVKNQARMHGRNDDMPYGSTEDALRRWPETATAVAVRSCGDALVMLAPYGLDDLFTMTIRPTPVFRGDKLPLVLTRVREKRWLDRWPLARLATARR